MNHLMNDMSIISRSVGTLVISEVRWVAQRREVGRLTRSRLDKRHHPLRLQVPLGLAEGYRKSLRHTPAFQSLGFLGSRACRHPECARDLSGWSVQAARVKSGPNGRARSPAVRSGYPRVRPASPF